MSRLIKGASTMFCLQLFMLGAVGSGMAQQAPPRTGEQSDEAPADQETARPGFEVLPPSQGDSISVLPLDDVKSPPDDERSSAAPAGEEGADTSDGPEGNTLSAAPEVDTSPDNAAPITPQTSHSSVRSPSGVSDISQPGAAQSFMPHKNTLGVEEQGQEPISYREVTVRALEKVTARTKDIVIPIGKTVEFHSLNITLRTCNKRPPEETPETTAFLEISENKPDGEVVKYFTGWMFASSPGLNGLEHPVYDVWVIDCKISEPDKSDGIE